MLYELRIDCFALNIDDFDDVIDKLNDLKPQLVVIHPGQPNQECSVTNLIENHHDHEPPEPCHIISHWDNCPLAPD